MYSMLVVCNVPLHIPHIQYLPRRMNRRHVGTPIKEAKAGGGEQWDTMGGERWEENGETE